METNSFTTKEFIAPSGHTYVIREQNGADDDVISNYGDSKNLMNISNFIAGIVQKTTFTTSGKLTPEQAHSLPLLDKYCIILQSRIFSLGSTLEFTYKWDEGQIVGYEQDLNDFLYDYGKTPSLEELNEKPNAIPFYPQGKEFVNIPIVTSSGKNLTFDVMTSVGEVYLTNLPLDKQSKNSTLLARNLKLEVDGKYERVSNFAMFSMRDMAEIRRSVAANDPTFTGLTDIENPSTGQKAQLNIVGIEGFFYPGEI